MSGMNRLVVGVSGASGAVLAVNLLEQMLAYQDWETHLVVTAGAKRTIELEMTRTLSEIEALATRVYDLEDIGASIASGTFRTAGMVVVPCSMKTLAGIAHGYSDNLLLRAADVTLKERRPLVLVARETPFSRVHLQNMSLLASYGVTLMPPMMTFYNHPLTLQDMQSHIVGKVLSEFGLECRDFRRWGEDVAASSPETKVHSVIG